MEGSRLLAGCIGWGVEDETLPSHLKNLVYTIEIACATNHTQRAVRVTLFNQKE